MTHQRKGAEGKVEPGYVCSLLSREALCERERLHFHLLEEKLEVKVPFRRDKGSPRRQHLSNGLGGRGRQIMEGVDAMTFVSNTE